MKQLQHAFSFLPSTLPGSPKKRGEASEDWNKRTRGNRLAVVVTNSVGTGRGTGKKITLKCGSLQSLQLVRIPLPLDNFTAQPKKTSWAKYVFCPLQLLVHTKCNTPLLFSAMKFALPAARHFLNLIC